MPEIFLQCVIVLYKCTFEDSKTLQSLIQFCHNQGNLAEQIALLIYDNSPTSQEIGAASFHCGVFEYRHSKENGGLAAAYNEALEIAQKRGTEWILLLDQDTTLNADLISNISTTIAFSLPKDVCAIVPKLTQRGKVLSPQRVGRIRNHSLLVMTSGLQIGPVTAFNSAACLRVSSVISVGGFPLLYWLDYLDHIMFHRLQAAGGRVFILDIAMEHRLSLENLEEEMSFSRYSNLLTAEWRFVRETKWGGGPIFHRLRLLRRAFRYAIRLHNQAYAVQTLHAVFE